MPSYLDFDTTKNIRDFILSKTLQKPDGPQTFTANNYEYNKLSSYSNTDPGDVVKNDVTSRTNELSKIRNLNLFKPEQYRVYENLSNQIINNGLLKLYPYFSTDVPKYNIIGILGNDKYENESKLFQFAASNIKDNIDGPYRSRIRSNFDRNVNGKNRLLDAIDGFTPTAINIFTGKESLYELNNTITVSKTLPGKGIDFLEALAGVTTPFSQIPGDYLTNPNNTVKQRPYTTELGRVVQDITGNLGSLVGIQRRNLTTTKPSDILLDYTGQGSKQALYNLLSYSTYAPDYTTTARSQNTSKIFNFIDNDSQSIKSIIGIEAPKGISYIGDDRGNDVKYATNDINGRQVRSNYYLSLMFDKVGAELTHKSNDLVWISRKSKNKLGANNQNYTQIQSDFDKIMSTKYSFRDDSILGKTQEILDSMPDNGIESRSHVANVIDQTSRFFIDGDTKISRGSAVKYVEKYNKEEAGIEYCRVWTKDRPYSHYSDTMKRTSNIRKFDSSVLGGESRVWNLNIAPISSGKGTFENSTNIDVDTFTAKKYMLSIENLAWKTSNTDGFRISDLPVSERGNNGGRVMWFPPYGLKVSEQNAAKWNENSFMGRPEPIYTYNNTSRSGTVGFKIVVDHPSILNLLVQKEIEKLSDEESENFINAFFAGCKDLDFYELIQNYSKINSNDADLILKYLNAGKTNLTEQKIVTYNTVVDPVVKPSPITTIAPTEPIKYEGKLYFDNDYPKGGSTGVKTNDSFNTLYSTFTAKSGKTMDNLEQNLTTLFNNKNKNDYKVLFNTENPLKNKTSEQLITFHKGLLETGFNNLGNSYNKLNEYIVKLKTDIESNLVKEVTINIETASSSAGDGSYNFYLAIRRAYSIVIDLINKLSVGSPPINSLNWFTIKELSQYKKYGINPPLQKKIDFKDFGYKSEGNVLFLFRTNGENVSLIKPVDGLDTLNCNQDISTPGLRITSPNAFYCRQASIEIGYGKSVQSIISEDKPIDNIITKAKQIDVPNNNNNTVKKPPISKMLSIISKTLGEQYYFNKLEEDSPLVFKSLKEKLKYFHPGFHSMTPEGLNSRLTFLLQCIRPGESIPINGSDEITNLNARNTTFGPPPVCVIRIGDFYHSKIIIRDVNITYDEEVWDFNPEGIGVQPMIANVTLQVYFIGGQGLEKPVERLQNALSSNFFANTEMYDERSTNTSKINNEDSNDFAKEFLEKLLDKPINKLTASTARGQENNFTKSEFIGGNNEFKNYTPIIDNLYNYVNGYLSNYSTLYNDSIKDYGNIITGLILSSKYRKTNRFIFNVDGSESEINLIGLYDKDKELGKNVTEFKKVLTEKIKTTNFVSFFNISSIITENLKNTFNQTVINYLISSIVNTKIDEISSLKTITDLEDSRDRLIGILNKLNFLTKYGHDVTIIKDKVFTGELSGFTVNSFYSEFSSAIDYLKNKLYNVESGLNLTSIDFDKPTINDELLKELLSKLLYKYKQGIITIIQSFSLIKTKKMNEKIENIINDFVKVDNTKDFKLGKKIERKNDKVIEYFLTANNEVTDNVELNESQNLWYNGSFLKEPYLNYYKK
jgi:succinate dehydrogenase flavin-adding protein (antitoxin of CptAB toxin-antitoxin module)